MCNNCKYWKHTGDRVKSIGDAHYTSRLGTCSNPVVRDLVFAVPDLNFVILTHKTEFDESFGCIFEESDNN